jgi:hypothetical protein
MLEFITFLLAPIGYAALTATTVLAAHGRMPVMLWRLTALVIVVHVALVWHVRYEWQLSEATRNGYVGFAVFHGALTAILLSLVLDSRVARRLITAAFVAVTVGAIGATFRYEVVDQYRIPVLIIAVAGFTGLTYRLATRLVRRPANTG